MANGMVDSRIVQMQFDNEQFERGIKTSSASLDEFKKHLDFSSFGGSIEEFADKLKNIDFDVVADNLQKITEKVAGLGDIFDLVFRQIRNAIHSAVYSAERFFNTMTSDQIDVGMDKFSQMTKNVQTIMAATGDTEATVYKVLGRLNEFTDQTSYNFTDMAENIGKFTSVGIDLESAEKQMEGIANWAARSGGGIGEASRAMYNLSQAMGVGALTKQDWMSIENASMATKEFKEKLMEAGVAAGTLEKTVDKGGNASYKTAKKFGTQVEVTYKNLSDTLSKKWVDTATMQKAFLSYYFDDLYYQRDTILDTAIEDNLISKEDWKELKNAEVATDEYKQTVMDAAVEVGNLTKETQKDGTVIYKTAAKFGEEMAVTYATFEESLGKGWFNKDVKDKADAMGSLGKASYEAAQKCMTFNDVIGAWQDQLSTGWMQSFRSIFGDLSEAMEVFSNICNKVGDALGELSGYRNDLLKYWGDDGGRYNLWSLVIGQVLDEGEVVAYEDAYGFLDVLDDIRKMLSEAFHKFLAIFMGGDIALLAEENKEWEFAAISVGIDNLIDTIRNFITSIHDFFEATARGSDKSRWEQVQDVVIAMYSVFMLAYSVIRDISTFIGILFDESHFGPLIDSFIQVFSELGITVTDLSKSSVEGRPFLVFLLTLLEVASPLVKVIVLLGQTLADIITTILQSARSEDNVNGFWAGFIGLVSTLASVVTAVATPILGFITSLVSAFGDLFKNGINEKSLASVGEKLKLAFKTMLDSLFFFIPNFSSRVKGFFVKIKDGIKKGFENGDFTSLIIQFKGLGSRILDSIPDSFKEKVSSVLMKIKNFFSGLWTNIKTIIKSIFGGGSKKESGGVTEAVTDAAGQAIGGSSNGGLFDSVKKSFDNFSDNLSDSLEKNGTSIFDKVKTIFTNIWNKIKGFISSLFGGGEVKKEATDVVNKVAEDSTTALDEAGKGGILKTIFDKVKSIFDNIVTELQVFLGNTKGTVGSFGASFKASVLDPLMKFLKGFDLSTILLAVVGFLGVKGLFKVVGNVVKIIKQTTEAINNVTKVMKGGIKGLLQGSDDDDDEKANIGDTLLKIAAALAVLTLAITVLANLDAKGAQNALVILGVASALLMGMAFLLNYIYKDTEYEQAASSFIGIMSIALALFMLMKAIEPLAKLNQGQMLTAIGMTWNVAIALVAVCFAFKKLEFEKDDGLGALAVAGAMYLLIVALMKLKDLKPEQLTTMFVSLGVILTELGAFVWAVNRFAKGGLAGSGMKELAFVALSIGILIFSLIPLAFLKEPQLIQMGVSLAAILTLLALFILGVSGINNKIGGLKGSGMIQLIAVALTIQILVISLLPLAFLKEQQLKQMGIGMVALMVAVTLFIWAVSGINKKLGGLKGSGMAQLIAVAFSIQMLVIALLPLAFLKEEQLKQMGIGMVALMGAVTLFIWAVSGINKKLGGMKDSGMTQLIAVAGAIFLLMIALLPLAIMNWEQFARVMIGVIVILGMLSVVLVAAKKLNKSSALSAVIMMVSLAGLIYMFSMSMSLIPKDLDWKAIAAVAVGLAIIIAAIGLALKMAADSKAGIKEAAIVIGAITVGVAALLAVLSVMLPVLMGSVGSALVTMASRLELAGKMLNGLVNTLSSLNGAAIDDGGNKVDKIFGIIKKFEGCSKYLKPIDDFETCMLKLGTALNTFQTSTEKITNPEGSNGLALLDKLLGYVDKVKPINNYEDFVTSAIYLGAGLSVFSTQSADISVDNANNAFALLDKLITYESFEDKLVDVINFTNNASYMAGGLAGFMTNASGIVFEDANGTFSLIDKLITYTSFEGLFIGSGDFATRVSNISGGLVTFMANASGIVFDNASGAFSLMDKLVTYTSFSGLFAGSYDFSTRVSYLGGGLASFMTNASSITDGNPPALQFLTNMANNANNINTLATIELGGFADQMSALGGGLSIYALGVKDASGIEIGDIPDVSGAINILTSLVEGLKMEGIDGEDFKLPELPEGSNFTTFGTQLAALAGGLIKFAEASDSLKSFNKAKQVLAFLNNLRLNLTAQNIATTHLLTDSGTTSDFLTQFGNDMAALGGSMKTYSEATKDFVKNEGALDVLDFMYELKAKLSGTENSFDGDMFKTIKNAGLDDTALTKFGTDMSALGGSMKTYSENTADFKKNQGALDVLDFMYELKNKLSGEGKSFDWDIFGIFEEKKLDDQALTKFGTDMAALGGSMKTYSDATADFKKNESALDALDFLYDLKVKLSDTEDRKLDWDIFNIFTKHELDNTALTKFGTDIAALGGSMETYYNATKDFAFSEEEGPFAALTFFDKLQTSLQNKSIKKDIIEGFFGEVEDQDLEDFGKQIGELGTSLAGFAASVNFTDGETTKKLNFDNAIAAVGALKDIALTLPVIGGVEGWIHGNVETLGGLSEDINLMGTALATFSEKLSGNSEISKVPYNAELVKSALEALSVIAELAMKLGQQAYGEYGIFTGYEFSESLARMVDAMSGIDGSTFSQSWIDNMVAFMKKFEDAALAVGGFKDSTIFTAFANMAKGLEQLTVAGTQTNFTDVGKSIIEGVAVGIENNQSRAVDALVHAALAAYAAGKAAIDMNSPSKLFATLGESMSSGVAVGIENNADQAAEAGEQMATDTFGFTSSIATMLENLLNDKTDFNPTITPVLDLSKVTEGASQINSLLGGEHTITIDATSSSLNADWALPYLSSISANQNKIDLTGIQNQLNNLQTAVNNVNTTVGNLKIYINKNVIAGAVTDDVDRGIGRNMLYASRNN